jgi:hypothetical protein
MRFIPRTSGPSFIRLVAMFKKLLSSFGDNTLAQDFNRFLQTPQAAQVFKRKGFLVGN